MALNRFRSVVCYALLAVGAFAMVLPFAWMVLTSFKTASEVSTVPPTILPQAPTLENYLYAFQNAPFSTYFLNSIIVTACCTVATLFTTVLAAFAFSRLRFPGRDVLFTLLLALMMIPFEMLIITNYQTVVNLGVTDTLVALIIPFTSSIFYTFIMRNAFLAVPDGLYWSARVDGASNWRFLWRIMVPICRPSLVTVGLLNAITCWNSFLWTVIATNSDSARTLPFGIYSFMTSAGIRYERLMAAAAIVIIPMVLLFICCRKSIVTGVSRGGLKG